MDLGFGICVKHRPGNGIWAKLGLGNSIYTPQDFHMNEKYLLEPRLMFELVPDEPVSQVCRGIKFPLTPCKLDQGDTIYLRSLRARKQKRS